MAKKNVYSSTTDEGNTSTSEYQGSISSEPSEFCEDYSNPPTRAPEEPPQKKMRCGPATVAATSRQRVHRAIAAARAYIRQNTTHLTDNEKVEVQNNIHGRKRSKEIALGDAVMHSIREFQTWCDKDPVLSNERRLQAQRIVAMATVPISDARLDNLYSKKTGVARKKIEAVRDRRANVAKHHLTEEGIFGTQREPRGTLIPWDMQKEAMNFWMTQTAPRNKGAGQKAQVLTLLILNDTHV